MHSTDPTLRWLSVRLRRVCIVVFVFGSLLPPYIPKAALAPQEVDTAARQFLLVEDGFLMKSSSLTKQGSRRAYAEGTIHTVKEGESLEKLSNRYGISTQTIVWVNKLEEGQSIQPGQELLILPVDGVLHTVKRGQTLLGIADLYDIPSDTIAEQNKVRGGYILVGQELIIPGGSPVIAPPVQVAVAPEQKPKPKPEPAKPVAKKPAPVQPKPKPSPSFATTPTSGVLQKPCSDKCFITQYFHRGHFALDMQEKGGGPIYAAEAGVVTRADYGWNGGYGNVIEIDHGNELITLYAHNSDLHVGVGDHVQRGQKIADMGNTGLVYGPTGIHTHFEVQLRGIKKNPLLYIQ